MNSTSATFQSMTWVLIFTFLSIAPFAVLSGPGFFAVIRLGMGWQLFGQRLSVGFYPIICGWRVLSIFQLHVSTVLLLSEIVVAVILSIVVLKEPITIFSTIGAFLIVIAIALVSVQRQKSQGTTKAEKSSSLLNA